MSISLSSSLVDFDLLVLRTRIFPRASMVFSTSKMANVDDDRRWLHSDADLISGHGVSYHVQVTHLPLNCQRLSLGISSSNFSISAPSKFSVR